MLLIHRPPTLPLHIHRAYPQAGATQKDATIAFLLELLGYLGLLGIGHIYAAERDEVSPCL